MVKKLVQYQTASKRQIQDPNLANTAPVSAGRTIREALFP